MLESGDEALQQPNAGLVIETPEDAAQEEDTRQEVVLALLNVFVKRTCHEEFALSKGHSVGQLLRQVLLPALQQILRRVLDLKLELREAAGKIRSERARFARSVDNQSLAIFVYIGTG
jgi:hypothetical protein